MKVSLVGAGSVVFTSALVKAMCNTELAREADVTLSLLDRDPARLAVVSSIATKTVDYYERKRPGLRVKVEGTPKRSESFEGTDFAVQTISVGGVDAARMDGSIPKKYGIYQVIGDSVGPGGFMAGLRQIPVVVEIGRDLHDIAPGARLVNFSNPTPPIVRAVLRETQAEIFGMCTSILGFVTDAAKLFGCAEDEVVVGEAGINHFTWVTRLEVKGEDVRDEFIDRLSRTPRDPPFDEYDLSLKLHELFGLFPVPGDRHVAEFFPRLFLSGEERKKYRIPITPERTIYSEERRGPILRAMQAAADGSMAIEEFLTQRFLEEESTESAKVIEAMALGRKRYVPGVNVLNDGLVEDLPGWAVVEVPAWVDSGGVHPVPQKGLPGALTGMMAERAAYFEKLVNAALGQRRDLAVQALLLDGYVTSEAGTKEMLEEMLGAEAKWLPEGWARKAAG